MVLIMPPALDLQMLYLLSTVSISVIVPLYCAYMQSLKVFRSVAVPEISLTLTRTK